MEKRQITQVFVTVTVRLISSSHHFITHSIFSQALATCTSSLHYDPTTLLQIRNSIEQFSANWGYNFLPPLPLRGLLLPPPQRSTWKCGSMGVQVWLRWSRRLLPRYGQKEFTSYLCPISLQAPKEDNDPQPLPRYSQFYRSLCPLCVIAPQTSCLSAITSQSAVFCATCLWSHTH